MELHDAESWPRRHLHRHTKIKEDFQAVFPEFPNQGSSHSLEPPSLEPPKLLGMDMMWPIFIFFIMFAALIMLSICYFWRAHGFGFMHWQRFRAPPRSAVLVTSSPTTLLGVISPTVTVYRRMSPMPCPTDGPAPNTTGLSQPTATPYPHSMSHAAPPTAPNANVCPPSYEQAMRHEKQPRSNTNRPY